MIKTISARNAKAEKRYKKVGLGRKNNRTCSQYHTVWLSDYYI